MIIINLFGTPLDNLILNCIQIYQNKTIYNRITDLINIINESLNSDGLFSKNAT